jgi:hypothetical protein
MEEAAVENDGIRDISPLERVQRVKESVRRRDQGGRRKPGGSGRQPVEEPAPEPREPEAADEGEGAEDPPAKGRHLDVRV